MKIKKLGQSCLVIETKGKKIVTDPGTFSIDAQIKERDIDLILITHQHGDHFHLESLKEMLKHNPQAKIITNDSISKILSEAGLTAQVLPDKVPQNIDGVEITAFACPHEELFQEFGQVENTAFLIDQRLFHPGDSFYNPGVPVEILALPVAGPWSRVRDFVNYALAVKPKVCFPFHDGMLVNPSGSAKMISEAVFPKYGITMKILDIGQTEEF